MFNKKANSERGEGPDEMAAPSSSGASSHSAAPSASTPAGNTEPKATKTPSSSPASSGGSGTVLAEGCRFEGKADVSGTLRVEGRAKGDLKASDRLVVGKTGDVQAEVTTRHAVVNGRFRGKIAASDRAELQAGSDIEADIKAKNMVMEDGVQYRGNLEIGG